MDLYLAAGGGADLIAAVMIQRATGHAGDPVLSYSWDRLIYDPVPGPRSPDDFTGLEPSGRLNYRVLPSSAARSPARSTLPRLADELACPLYLLDPWGGAVRMAEQVRELVAILGPQAAHVVDVGGDILATGDEPTLRSPLADALALAATRGLPCPVDVLVAGPGLDGELSEADVLTRCQNLSATRSPQLRLSAEPVQPLASTLTWMPSEASALLWAAAIGVRGAAEIRDHGALVNLTDHSPEVHRLPHDRVLRANRLASSLLSSRSLEQAEATIRLLGSQSEVDVERAKAATRRLTDISLDDDTLRACLENLDRTAGARGATFVTIRRVAEHVGLTTPALEELAARLCRLAPARCRPPLWFLDPSTRLKPSLSPRTA